MGLCLCGSVCVVHKGLDGSLDILTGADALQHVPPLGTCGCPARSDLVVVAQISHELAVLAHDLVVGVDIAHAGADREVGGSQHTVLDLIGVGSDEVDEGPGCFDLGLVAVIKDAEAPDAAAQLRVAAVGGEGHGGRSRRHRWSDRRHCCRCWPAVQCSSRRPSAGCRCGTG